MGEANGTTNGTPDWKQWATERRTAIVLGISLKDMHKLYSDLLIEPVRCEDKTIRLRPEDAEAIEAHLTNQTQGEKNTQASVIRAANDHTERMFKLLEQPTKMVLELLSSENERLRARIEQLEKTHDAAIVAREELLSGAAARELEAARQKGSDDRKRQAFALLMQQAPRLLDQIAATLANGGNRKMSKALELLESLEPVKLEALCESGFVDDHQKGLLRELIPMLGKTNAGEPQQQEGTEEHGNSESSAPLEPERSPVP